MRNGTATFWKRSTPVTARPAAAARPMARVMSLSFVMKCSAMRLRATGKVQRESSDRHHGAVRSGEGGMASLCAEGGMVSGSG